MDHHHFPKLATRDTWEQHWLFTDTLTLHGHSLQEHVGQVGSALPRKALDLGRLRIRNVRLWISMPARNFTCGQRVPRLGWSVC
eukprot:4828676-Amphidinium_carterae.1